MKAARWYGRGDVRIEEVPEPPHPAPGFVKVQVAWCGICGSDLGEYLDGPVLIPTQRPHPLTGQMAPVILGHEFSGQVVEVGEEVNNTAVGDRVTADACWYCGECYWCRRFQYNICARGASTGLGADGAFARFVNVPAYTLYKLDDRVSYEMGALVEPLSVGVHAVKRGGVSIGDNVAIVGVGTIGLAVLQAAKQAGAKRAVAIDMVKSRLDLARRLGADAVLNAAEFDARGLRREVGRLCDGIGADVAFECVGHPQTAALAIELARRAGTGVICGLFKEAGPLDFQRIVTHEKVVLGSLGYAGDFSTTIALLADGRIKGEPMITGRIKLSDLVEKGFKALAASKEQVKIIVEPE